MSVEVDYWLQITGKNPGDHWSADLCGKVFFSGDGLIYVATKKYWFRLDKSLGNYLALISLLRAADTLGSLTKVWIACSTKPLKDNHSNHTVIGFKLEEDGRECFVEGLTFTSNADTSLATTVDRAAALELYKKLKDFGVF